MKNKNATTRRWGRFYVFLSADYVSVGFIHKDINYILFTIKQKMRTPYLKVPKRPFIIPYLNMNRRETNSQRLLNE